MSDFDANVIKEFRANGGQVPGWDEKWQLLLLHHVGARSGTERINPLVFQGVGDSYAIFASKGGAPDNPDWFHNLMAHPETKIELGDKTVEVTARVAEGSERHDIWERQKATLGNFAEYEAKTDRQIPVVVLDPR